ncbi:MAG: FapA family protein [Pseudomonadales bacterium]
MSVDRSNGSPGRAVTGSGARELREFIAVGWELCEASGELTACLTKTDAPSRNDIQSLKNQLRAAGYDAFDMAEAALPDILKHINAGQTGRYHVATRRDANVSIAVSDDAMEARISTSPCFGGLPLTEQRIIQAIDQAGIVRARCDRHVIEQALSARAVSDLLLARGTPMQRGRDARFVPLVEGVIKRPLVEDRAGRVDFHDIHEFTFVAVGDALMRLEPPTPGVSGADVYGRAIPAEPGNALAFPGSLQGAMLDPNDPHLLVAAIRGHPVVMANAVHVDNVLTLDNVDIASGNVTFEGSLVVRGEVGSGASIDVTGDVQIKGVVDRASIVAGNDIEIGGGVFGEETCDGEDCGFAAQLSAGGSVTAKFLSCVLVRAENVVSVREYISHSTVIGKLAVRIGQDGGKGALIGGDCHSDAEVRVNILGTDANVPTAVSVGQGTGLDSVYPGEARGAAHKRPEARVLVKQRAYPNARITINGRVLKLRMQVDGGCFVCRDAAVTLTEA